MSHRLRNEKGELLELKHEAVPGYKKAFYIAFAFGSLYLLLLFVIASMN